MKFKNLKRSSKTEEIRKILHKSLIENEFKPGELFLSENELSKRFRVSRDTAREATTVLVAEGFLHRVQGKGTVVTTPIDTKELGIIFFDVFDPKEPHIHGIISGIEERAKVKHWHLHLYTTRGKDVWKENGIVKNLILCHRVHGLFVLSPLSSQDLLFFKKEGIPFVVLNNEYPDLKVNTVLFNHYQASHEIVERLIREGHRRIGLLTGPFEKKNHIIRGGEQVLSGYKDALSKHSIPFIPSLVKEREHSEKAGYSAVEEFFSSPGRPSALLITSASLTDGVYKFLGEKNLGHDITVVGYFNKRETVIQPGFFLPLSKLGKTSFTLLEESMNSKNEPKKIEIPLEIIWE